MKNVGVIIFVNRARLFAAFVLLTVILASGGLSSTSAQGSGDWAIEPAQRAVRQQITSREGGRNPTVLFNSDAQTEFMANTGVRIHGTGAFSRNNDPRYNNGQSRNFSYEAIVNNRNRNRNSNSNVSGVRYDWRGGWSGNGGGDGGYGRQSIYCASDDGRRHTCPVNTGGGVRLVNQKSGSACVEGRTWGFNNNGIWVDRGCRADFEVSGGRGDGRNNDRYGDGGYRVQSIYCASDDGRRHNCPINTSSGGVRLVNQKSGSACVEGRTWGFNNNGIWVDRGCRADFEVGRGNDRRDNNGGYSDANRPNGRVSYSGPIMNRHSDKALDVTEQGMQDGANIQQWSYADQPNQNWDVIDLGNNEVAIISRHSGRALTVQGGRDNNGANIIQRGWNWNDNPQQRWRLEQTGGDYYRIVSVDNGKCLDVTQQGKENGANIQLWDYANQSNQQWRFKR